MDIFISFFAMPIGVMVCFGPAILLWLIQEYKSPAEQGQNDSRQPAPTAGAVPADQSRGRKATLI